MLYKKILYFSIIFLMVGICVGLFLLEYFSHLIAVLNHHLRYDFTYYNHHFFTPFNLKFLIIFVCIIFAITLVKLVKNFKNFNFYKKFAFILELFCLAFLLLLFKQIVFFDLLIYPYIVFAVGVGFVLSLWLCVLKVR